MTSQAGQCRITTAGILIFFWPFVYRIQQQIFKVWLEVWMCAQDGTMRSFLLWLTHLIGRIYSHHVFFILVTEQWHMVLFLFPQRNHIEPQIMSLSLTLLYNYRTMPVSLWFPTRQMKGKMWAVISSSPLYWRCLKYRIVSSMVPALSKPHFYAHGTKVTLLDLSLGQWSSNHLHSVTEIYLSKPWKWHGFWQNWTVFWFVCYHLWHCHWLWESSWLEHLSTSGTTCCVWISCTSCGWYGDFSRHCTGTHSGDIIFRTPASSPTLSTTGSRPWRSAYVLVHQ